MLFVWTEDSRAMLPIRHARLSMLRFPHPFRNRLDLPVLDHALLVAAVAVLLLGLSGDVRDALAGLVIRMTGLYL